jgi:hypothetical protein
MIAKDITLSSEWIDIYEELGVTKDKDIFIQNKSAGSVYIWPKDILPNTVTEGAHLKVGDTTTVNADGEALHVRGLGDIYAAVITVASPTLVLPQEAFNVTVEAGSVLVNNTEAQRVPVNISTVTSINNTTSANLLANAVWTGTGDDVSGVGTILVGVYADVPSVVGGLEFQTSPDQVDWYPMESFTYENDHPSVYSMSPIFKYFRIKYTNGGAPTAKLAIQTYYKQSYVKPSSHRMGDIISGENDAELVKAVLTAMKPDNLYTNIHATSGGNLKISLEEYDAGLGRLPVDTTGIPTVPRSRATTTASSNIVLSAGIKRITIYARFADARYMLGTGVQLADDETSHYLPMGTLVPMTVPADANIAVIRDSLATVNGLVEISEYI